jgi:hypothetical protein
MFADVTGRRCIRGRRSPHSTSQQRQPACRTSCPAPVWWFERCAQNPIPSRTRPLNTPAPMVLCLKTRESRSPPDLHRTRTTSPQKRSSYTHRATSVALDRGRLSHVAHRRVAVGTQTSLEPDRNYARAQPCSIPKTPARWARTAPVRTVGTDLNLREEPFSKVEM